ncbi:MULTISPECIES: dihydroorotase [Fischerella]|uniref:Dihydroorotase n=1 Tax=Fischerella muscicola CCMEE 5323 TaxID=2019572 RepID=A0A2N6K1Y4_FISMU|nr:MULTISPECIES: dihydroorotase [Fischerella]MBD2430567.1 dihydroorotase [Fischerella sp. FACHB-380]PLZ88774.1 dihydroorotase [Fischerella muscicola CCMEE 5323]
MTSELLQQVRIVDPVSGTDQVADVLIDDGYIQSVANSISDVPEDTLVQDCSGLVLGTGLIDLYSHSGEPGFEERETLCSLLKAAAAGGFTRISILPDTSPAVDNPAVVAQLLELGRWGEKSTPLPHHPTTLSQKPHLNIWGAITLDVAGKQMTELADLAVAGVVGFADGQPLENTALVRRVLEYLQPLGKPVALWCCDRQLRSNGVMREGPDSLRFGLPGNPAASETSAIAALIELVAATGTPVHIMRVSTARSVELIASAKSQGLPITASTTWMHVLLDTESLKSYNPNLNLDPPLGNPSDLLALRQAVRTGIIDAIAIDHAPYTYEEKTVAFAEAPPGAIGLELALPLLWQHLVETGEFSALQLWQALSSRPAECLKQNLSAIVPGQKAELTLFDPQQSWKVDRQNLRTLSQNTPWLGQQLTGRVVKIWIP